MQVSAGAELCSERGREAAAGTALDGTTGEVCGAYPGTRQTPHRAEKKERRCGQPKRGSGAKQLQEKAIIPRDMIQGWCRAHPLLSLGWPGPLSTPGLQNQPGCRAIQRRWPCTTAAVHRSPSSTFVKKDCRMWLRTLCRSNCSICMSSSGCDQLHRNVDHHNLLVKCISQAPFSQKAGQSPD